MGAVVVIIAPVSIDAVAQLGTVDLRFPFMTISKGRFTGVDSGGFVALAEGIGEAYIVSDRLVTICGRVVELKRPRSVPPRIPVNRYSRSSKKSG